MERQSTSQQRDEEKKEQKTKDKSKYSSGLRCLQSVCGRGDWLLPVVPLPRLTSAFFFLSSQKRLPIQMTKKKEGVIEKEKKQQAQTSFFLSTLVRNHTPLTQVRHCCSGNAQYHQYCSAGGKKGIGVAASQALPTSWGRILSWNCSVSPLPPIPAKKMGGWEVGPLTALVFIERVWEWERERGERDMRRWRRRRGGAFQQMSRNQTGVWNW